MKDNKKTENTTETTQEEIKRRIVSFVTIDTKFSDILLSIDGCIRLEVWKMEHGVAVQLANCDISDGPCLLSKYGVGETFEKACLDYYHKIKGKTLVYTHFGKQEKIYIE